MRHATRGPRYWSARSPAGPWDYLVVGSGVGGMTAAALLARLGHRVLVLEQHYLPGGFTHTFTHDGYTFDVGVHAVGEVTRHTLTGRLLEHLTGGRLRFASLGPVYEHFHFPDGFRIDFPDHPERFRAHLLAAFPGEARAIDGYLREVRRVAAAMPRHYLARTLPGPLAGLAERSFARQARRLFALTTRQVVAGLTDDARLRAVLTAQWGYYGSPPSRSSFVMQAMVTRHFLHGGYYPVGGSQEISRCLLRTVAEAGGWTRIHAGVEELLVEGGRAVGVRLDGGEEIRARRVVVASGIATAVRRLLPEAQRHRPWARSVAALPPGPAHVCLYLGFQGDIRQAGASAANQWYYDTWSHEDEVWRVSPEAPPGPAPVLYVSFPSLKDPSHDAGPDERHTGEVVTFVPWETFAPWAGRPWRQRGAAYEAFKERLEIRLLDQLLDRLPGLRSLVRHRELSTPATTDTFDRPLAGSIYGLEPTPERFRHPGLRPRSPIPGLFFAGSDVTTGGVMGAMMGGVLAVAAAEPRATIGMLRRL